MPCGGLSLAFRSITQKPLKFGAPDDLLEAAVARIATGAIAAATSMSAPAAIATFLSLIASSVPAGSVAHVQTVPETLGRNMAWGSKMSPPPSQSVTRVPRECHKFGPDDEGRRSYGEGMELARG